MVPLDGSTFGEQALPLAVNIARRCEARLHLVNVFSPVGNMVVEGYLFPNDNVEIYLQHQQVQYLHRIAGQLRELTPAPVAIHHLQGSVVEEVRKQAMECKPDLIVMTTHGRTPLSRFWLGSVADDLLRDAPAPILLVRPTAKATMDYQRDVLPRHLLIPLDGSPQAEEVLEPAVALGMLGRADYTLLQTLRPILPMTYQMERGGSLDRVATSLIEKIEAAQESLRKQGLDYLDRVAAPLRQRSLTVHTRIAIEEQPAAAILSAAETLVDCIAMRTHARHGLARLFRGSVTDKVVRGVHLPILVVPPRKG